MKERLGSGRRPRSWPSVQSEVDDLKQRGDAAKATTTPRRRALSNARLHELERLIKLRAEQTKKAQVVHLQEIENRKASATHKHLLKLQSLKDDAVDAAAQIARLHRAAEYLEELQAAYDLKQSLRRTSTRRSP